MRVQFPGTHVGVGSIPGQDTQVSGSVPAQGTYVGVGFSSQSGHTHRFRVQSQVRTHRWVLSSIPAQSTYVLWGSVPVRTHTPSRGARCLSAVGRPQGKNLQAGVTGFLQQLVGQRGGKEALGEAPAWHSDFTPGPPSRPWQVQLCLRRGKERGLL